MRTSTMPASPIGVSSPLNAPACASFCGAGGSTSVIAAASARSTA